VDFGPQPIANGFRSPGDKSEEYFFPMRVGFCSECMMVQLVDQPDREKMFHENYAFFSSTSKFMAIHFQAFAQTMMDNHMKGKKDPFYVEVGSNDGIMIRNYKAAGIRHLGVEPSANVAQVAKDAGINTVSEFFDETLAQKIVKEYGQADVIASANVMCHIPYLHSVAKGIKILLKNGGVFAFEDPYLADIVEKTSYDQIYDEHVFFFSAHSVGRLFAMHGLELVRVDAQDVHGGSMRYTIAHAGSVPKHASVEAQLKKEKDLGIPSAATYEKVRKNVERSRAELVALLKKLKAEGKRVVGYGATSKSATVANYCGIGPDLVEFISDTTPIKQGKVTPGMRIPVKPYDAFAQSYPDYALLFAWNHAKEIMAKESGFMKAGGKWIVYVPEVRVI
jgi:methylation protein EvaC